MSAEGRRARESRSAAIQQARRLHSEELLTEEQLAKIEERMTLDESTPTLDHEAYPVFESWQWFGPPCTVFGGMSMALVDERARLYPSRQMVLDRAEVLPESQEIYFRLWGELDEALIEFKTEQMSQ